MFRRCSLSTYLRVEVAHDHDNVTGGLVVCGGQQIIKIILRVYRRLFSIGVALYKCYVSDLIRILVVWYRFARNQAAVCSWYHQECDTCCFIDTFVFSGVKEYSVPRGRINSSTTDLSRLAQAQNIYIVAQKLILKLKYTI